MLTKDQNIENNILNKGKQRIHSRIHKVRGQEFKDWESLNLKTRKKEKKTYHIRG